MTLYKQPLLKGAALQDFLLIVDSRLALLPIHTGLRAQPGEKCSFSLFRPSYF